MAGNINLIHAGLPWTSPQKISIHSSQYINNIVINRGLLCLLNNDYYLEIKTQAINNFIENNIGNHINNQDLHVSWKRIKSLFSAVNSASEDAVYYIPLYFNGEQIEQQIIQNIIQMIPKNLNGHTVILCFCNAFSKSYVEKYETENEDTPLPIYNLINLSTYNIVLNGFIGGDLILYSTTRNDIRINNYQSLAQLQSKQNYALDIFTKVQEAIDSDTGFSEAVGLTLTGTGLNQNYSVLAIKNCQASIYVVNMQIENTLVWNETALNDEKNKIKLLPAKDDLLIFYPLHQFDNGKLTYKELYLNKNFLYKNSNYSLAYNNGKQTDIKSTNNQVGKVLSINSEDYLSSAIIPQYISCDNSTETLFSQQLRSYIYNWNNTPHFTIAFWGKLDNFGTNYTNSPLFVDYLNQNDTEFGLYVYLNKLYRTAIQDYTDAAQYSSDFQAYNNQIANNWGLYVLQFLHQKLNTTDSTVSALNNIPIASGYMRVNLSFYPSGATQPCILIPSETTIKNSTKEEITEEECRTYLHNVNYEFPVFTQGDFLNKKYSIKFFANTRLPNTNVLKNWDYFSGELRNIFFFKKILSRIEIKAILNSAPYNTAYHWLSQSEHNIINNINLSSSIGAVYSVNNQNLNFIKTVIKTNG